VDVVNEKFCIDVRFGTTFQNEIDTEADVVFRQLGSDG
jgi:hypothetical protein